MPYGQGGGDRFWCKKKYQNYLGRTKFRKPQRGESWFSPVFIIAEKGEDV